MQNNVYCVNLCGCDWQNRGLDLTIIQCQKAMQKCFTEDVPYYVSSKYIMYLKLVLQIIISKVLTREDVTL
jgi:hypothetical protein